MCDGGLMIGWCFDVIVDDVMSVDYREGESFAAYLKFDEGVFDVCIFVEVMLIVN